MSILGYGRLWNSASNIFVKITSHVIPVALESKYTYRRLLTCNEKPLTVSFNENNLMKSEHRLNLLCITGSSKLQYRLLHVSAPHTSGQFASGSKEENDMNRVSQLLKVSCVPCRYSSNVETVAFSRLEMLAIVYIRGYMEEIEKDEGRFFGRRYYNPKAIRAEKWNFILSHNSLDNIPEVIAFRHSINSRNLTAEEGAELLVQTYGQLSGVIHHPFQTQLTRQELITAINGTMKLMDPVKYMAIDVLNAEFRRKI